MTPHPRKNTEYSAALRAALDTPRGPSKPLSDNTVFCQTRPYDEVMKEWREFFALSIKVARGEHTT